jgi:hypothetical protein
MVLDCDVPGRRAAEALAGSLEPVGWAVAVLDLWPVNPRGGSMTGTSDRHA